MTATVCKRCQGRGKQTLYGDCSSIVSTCELCNGTGIIIRNPLLEQEDLELLRTINKELKDRKSLYSEVEVKLLILQFIDSDKPVSQFENWWEQNKKK